MTLIANVSLQVASMTYLQIDSQRLLNPKYITPLMNSRSFTVATQLAKLLAGKNDIQRTILPQILERDFRLLIYFELAVIHSGTSTSA